MPRRLQGILDEQIQIYSTGVAQVKAVHETMQEALQHPATSVKCGSADEQVTFAPLPPPISPPAEVLLSSVWQSQVWRQCLLLKHNRNLPKTKQSPLH